MPTPKSKKIKLSAITKRKLLAATIIFIAKVYHENPFKILYLCDPNPSGLLLKEVFKLACEQKMLGSDF